MIETPASSGVCVGCRHHDDGPDWVATAARFLNKSQQRKKSEQIGQGTGVPSDADVVQDKALTHPLHVLGTSWNKEA